MLDTGPPAPFQVDGNFGGTAAIAEALLQSHENVRLGGNWRGTRDASTAAYGNSTGLQPAYTGDLHKAPLIRLLPAVPTQWGANGGGSVHGLLARGGFEVNIKWASSGTLLFAEIISRVGGPVYVTLGATQIGSTGAGTIDVSGKKGDFVFVNAERGKTYKVTMA